MKIHILTLFPEMFAGPLDHSIVKRAKQKGLVEIEIHNLRNWASDKHKTVDDKPYGGGAGMVMKVEVIDKAIEELNNSKARVIITDPAGKKYNQQLAQNLAGEESLIILCGHYEGIDHRVHEHLATDVISVGDYVLSGGELPAMTIVDSVVRLLPGVLGNEDSIKEESHNDGELEYPQYTRPEDYKGWKVPEVLLSGDPKKIAAWKQSLKKSTTDN